MHCCIYDSTFHNDLYNYGINKLDILKGLLQRISIDLLWYLGHGTRSDYVSINRLVKEANINMQQQIWSKRYS